MENIFILKEINMKENLKIIKEKDMEYLIIQMEINIENGIILILMAME